MNDKVMEQQESKEVILKISHFSKAYKRDVKAVDDISLTVHAGDIYGFIGHNGAGKSTTIKAIAGILDFTEGEIEIGGHSVKNEPIPCKQMIAYIPDNPDIYEYMTGIQYLNFLGDVFEVGSLEREEKIKKYADMFEITAQLGDLVASYSHGMKQKVAIIGALIHEPRLLILDEPFVGLDPKAASELKKVMHELCAEGSAIFFSTHVLEVAEKLCTGISMIHHGKIIADGNVEQIIDKGTLEEFFLQQIEK